MRVEYVNGGLVIQVGGGYEAYLRDGSWLGSFGEERDARRVIGEELADALAEAWAYA